MFFKFLFILYVHNTMFDRPPPSVFWLLNKANSNHNVTNNLTSVT